MTNGDPIPPDDLVCRQVFSNMYDSGELDVNQLFRFHQVDGQQCFSVTWRRDALPLDDVHSRGCDKEMRDNQQRIAAGRNQIEYRGAMQAAHSGVVAIKSKNGHGLRVENYPENGDDLHSHVILAIIPEVPCNKNDRQDIRDSLFEIFRPLIDHACNRVHGQLGR